MGFDDDGLIAGFEMDLLRAAALGRLVPGVCDRTMFHADNAYFLPKLRILTPPLEDQYRSNTAFRGFGGPRACSPWSV